MRRGRKNAAATSAPWIQIAEILSVAIPVIQKPTRPALGIEPL